MESFHVGKSFISKLKPEKCCKKTTETNKFWKIVLKTAKSYQNRTKIKNLQEN